MRKLMVFGIAVVLALGAFALTACGSEDKADANVESGVENPWTEATSIEEAAEQAGIGSFEIAENLGIDIDLIDATYRSMEGVAEADFEGGAFDVCVRKGTMEGQELSGDYTEYPQSWNVEIYGTKVECHGYEPDMAAAFTWSDGDANYSVVFTGLGGENMAIGPVDLATVVTSIS